MMKMPGFTAVTSLSKTSGCYDIVAHESTSLTDQKVTIAFSLCDWFPWLPGCPSQTPPPGVTCQHKNTDTACTLFVQWCKDNSICSDGTTRSSGWYPCGACFGF